MKSFSRQGSTIPLRHDLAADLRGWLADKLTWLRSDSGAPFGPVTLRLPPDTPLFAVPAGLEVVMDRDLVFAGIARKVAQVIAWIRQVRSAAP